MQVTEWNNYLTPLFSHIHFIVHTINGIISEAGTYMNYVVLRHIEPVGYFAYTYICVKMRDLSYVS